MVNINLNTALFLAKLMSDDTKSKKLKPKFLGNQTVLVQNRYEMVGMMSLARYARYFWTNLRQPIFKNYFHHDF